MQADTHPTVCSTRTTKMIRKLLSDIPIKCSSATVTSAPD